MCAMTRDLTVCVTTCAFISPDGRKVIVTRLASFGADWEGFCRPRAKADCPEGAAPARTANASTATNDRNTWVPCGVPDRPGCVGGGGINPVILCNTLSCRRREPHPHRVHITGNTPTPPYPPAGRAERILYVPVGRHPIRWLRRHKEVPLSITGLLAPPA